MVTDVAGVVVYAEGVTALSACAPGDMPLAEVTERVNMLVPTGIEPSWIPDPAPAFKDGIPNPGPCEQAPGRKHYLFMC